MKTITFLWRAWFGLVPGVVVDMNGFPFVVRVYFDAKIWSFKQ